MSERYQATNGIIEFLMDESNRNVLDGLRIIFQRHSHLDRHLAMRSTVLGQFGTIPLEEGARMGLMVRFIELGLSLADWDRVITELKLDPKLENGETGV